MTNLTQIFKLLSDETRLRIIYLIYKEQLCVCQISAILDISQPKVSKAMSKLRDLGLVNDERSDKYMFYELISTHAILTNILNEVDRTVNNYPQLELDIKRLQNKEKIINLCITK